MKCIVLYLFRSCIFCITDCNITSAMQSDCILSRHILFITLIKTGVEQCRNVFMRKPQFIRYKISHIVLLTYKRISVFCRCLKYLSILFHSKSMRIDCPCPKTPSILKMLIGKTYITDVRRWMVLQIFLQNIVIFYWRRSSQRQIQ